MTELSIHHGAPEDAPPDVPDLDLLFRVGKGGFGEVWLAANRTTGLLRAVKLIPLDRAGREVESMIRLERRAAARHPSLLPIHHVGKTSRYVFCIMDPADDVTGGPASNSPTYRPATLKERLGAGPLSSAEALGCARQLLAGLAHLHRLGMVHRDVKPANCLFVGGDLKLADFGLVTEMNAGLSVVGTPKYMPPDGCMDARADVYSAGRVIYEILTALPVDRFPSLGNRGAEMARSPVLKALNRVALQAGHANPQKRFGDAGAMLVALETLLRPRRLWQVALLAVPMAMAAAAITLGLWWSHARPVRVNFLTSPYEATIVLDGKLFLQPDGTPFRSPCTIGDLPRGEHQVIFRREDGTEVDAGRIDFSQVREIAVFDRPHSAPAASQAKGPPQTAQP